MTTNPGVGAGPTVSAQNAVRLALLGAMGGTHIGGSLARGAVKLGIKSILFDAELAAAGSRLLRSLSWHLGDRHGAINGIGAREVATIGHCQRELLD